MPDLGKIFKGRRVLVTGDTGFKGSWLSLWLHQLGAEVTGYALPPASPDDLFGQLGLDRIIHHVDGDIRDLPHLQQVFGTARPEFLFHLAAQSLVRLSYAEPKLTFDTNVGGSVNILEAARATPTLRSVIYVTSDKCYKNKEWVWGYRENDELGGHDPYSASKAAAEIVFTAYFQSFLSANKSLGAASVRAGNVIGGGDWAADRIVPDSIKSLQAGKLLVLRNPEATRPWQHVLDPLYAYLQLAAQLDSNPDGFSGSWNFGPAEDSVKTVRQLTEKIISSWGCGEIVATRNEGALHEAGMLRLNCDKARHSLNWRPRWDFERAVNETVNWYKEVASGNSTLAVTQRQLLAYMEQVQ